MMVRTDVFQELEGFDEKFSPFGPEDLDFSLRCYQAGYHALYVPQALAYHEVSHSFEGGQYTELYARNKSRHWLVFMRRHASIPQQIAFYLVGAPLAIIQMVIREGRKGNWVALRGSVRGLFDTCRSLLKVQPYLVFVPPARRLKFRTVPWVIELPRCSAIFSIEEK